MARPRTPIGTFGQINFASETTTTVTAFTRFRDYDGRLRPVQATGSTRKQAEHNLKAVLARRSRIASGSTDLSGDSTFKRLVEIWFEDLDLQELAFSTRELYARDMRTLVLPAFKDYTLREISIMMVDRFLKKLAKESLSKAQHAKVVLNLALGLAVRYEAIEHNPVRSVTALVLNARAQSGRARTKVHTCEVRGFAAHRRFEMATHRPARESSTGPAPQTSQQAGTSATRLVSLR